MKEKILDQMEQPVKCHHCEQVFERKELNLITVIKRYLCDSCFEVIIETTKED